MDGTAGADDGEVGGVGLSISMTFVGIDGRSETHGLSVLRRKDMAPSELGPAAGGETIADDPGIWIDWIERVEWTRGNP